MILYGLFRCTECGREELKQVPFYGADVPYNYTTLQLCSEAQRPVMFGGRVSYRCPFEVEEISVERFNQREHVPCYGEMVLDTRYNFAGVLQCELWLDNRLRVAYHVCKFGETDWFYSSGLPVVEMDPALFAPLFV